MKFLCLDCDKVMTFQERQLPGDGTLAAVYACEGCRREMALLTNPMETRLVSSLGVQIGGREVPEQPLELVRTNLEEGREGAFEEAVSPAKDVRVEWSGEALDRLERVPNFVRGMVKRIYTDWAREREIDVITVETMDRARTALGLEEM